MIPWKDYLDDIIFSFRKHKDLAERAIASLDADEFFQKPGEQSNSVAIIVKHLAGNLTSRWTDFLTTDGEKPWRDRDAEFLIGPDDTREHLLAAWQKSWQILLESLASLDEADATKTVLIRSEKHTALQAIHRSLTHTCYHIGQITYLARLLKQGSAAWITIPPGGSKAHNAQQKPYLQAQG